jgi:hypothetical protein
MTQERIQEIANAFLQNLEEGVNFILWDDIRIVLRGEESVDETTLEILVDEVLNTIEEMADKQGVLYFYPGETYYYNGYKRANAGGITLIK